MGNDVIIDYGGVTARKQLLAGLVSSQLVSAGRGLCEKISGAWEESHAGSLLTMTWYLKQEQELVEVLGKGLDDVMTFLEQSAQDFQALDHAYSASHIK